jgi:hypothetical protein
MIRGSTLREFAKNSRIFKAFAPTETTVAQFSSLVDRSFRTALAFDKLMPLRQQKK